MKPTFIVLASALAMSSAAPLAPTPTTIDRSHAGTITPIIHKAASGSRTHKPSVHHRGNGIKNFCSFDLTHHPLTSEETLLEVNKLCPANATAAELRSIFDTIQRVDVTILHPAAFAAPANTPKSKALKCQLYRNIVLEQTCEHRADAILKTSAARVARIEASTRDAATKVDQFCKGADAKLFMDVPAAMATDARFRDRALDRVAFAKIDISKKPLDGSQSEAVAQFVCPASASSALLESNRRVAEDADLDLFNHAIKAAGMDAAKVQALTCERARNDILKNVCTINYYTIMNKSPEELASAKASLAASISDVNEFCTGIQTTVGPPQSPARRELPPPPRSSPSKPSRASEHPVPFAPGLVAVMSAVEDDDSPDSPAPIDPDEPIDFGLVYALHTFVANLEGQVCVLKGDSLDLLDDSNSYWWLVKCLKTDETPYERLARLNKQKNVEVTAVLEHDFADPDRISVAKARGPRRNVFFAENHEEFIEDSEDDDDDNDGEFGSPPFPVGSGVANGVGGSLGRANSVKKESAVAVGAAQESGSLGRNFLSKLLLRGNSKKKNVGSPPTEAPPAGVRSLDRSPTSATSSSPVTPTSLQPSSDAVSGLRENVSCLRQQPLNVLRIYAGNVDLKATFKTVALKESTTAIELIDAALKRFRVPGATPDEYYVSVLHMDSQEKRVNDTEKISSVLASLRTRHLPGVSDASPVAPARGQISAIRMNDDNLIKVLINKKLNLFEKNYHLVRIFMFDEHDATGKIRTYKTIGIGSEAVVTDLIELARKKFKLGAEDGVEYTVHSILNDEETLRDGSERVYSILMESKGSAEDMNFVLRRQRVPSTRSVTATDGVSSSSPQPSPTEAPLPSAQRNSGLGASLMSDLESILSSKPVFLEELPPSAASSMQSLYGTAGGAGGSGTTTPKSLSRQQSLEGSLDSLDAGGAGARGAAGTKAGAQSLFTGTETWLGAGSGASTPPSGSGSTVPSRQSSLPRSASKLAVRSESLAAGSAQTRTAPRSGVPVEAVAPAPAPSQTSSPPRRRSAQPESPSPQRRPSAQPESSPSPPRRPSAQPESPSPPRRPSALPESPSPQRASSRQSVTPPGSPNGLQVASPLRGSRANFEAMEAYLEEILKEDTDPTRLESLEEAFRRASAPPIAAPDTTTYSDSGLNAMLRSQKQSAISRKGSQASLSESLGTQAPPSRKGSQASLTDSAPPGTPPPRSGSFRTSLSQVFSDIEADIEKELEGRRAPSETTLATVDEQPAPRELPLAVATPEPEPVPADIAVLAVEKFKDAEALLGNMQRVCRPSRHSPILTADGLDRGAGSID
ncbi:hypothetical protein BDK51DRAFT_45614 [Blyttiomyces helicus]|uniref:Ras-associating domain-containing protein n=1 Tax=Blyttiomyces helicus TaxID=388810 RepID=A0A4P9WLH2_9FUNG|nr:hypothetical protein BDK51DRAFT_45614 [Blyttiomyces helicus]|eukprot:RKO91496.1 hypothetical protein BDK51DRAFT_45614 [Blyttiomyces helicus]